MNNEVRNKLKKKNNEKNCVDFQLCKCKPWKNNMFFRGLHFHNVCYIAYDTFFREMYVFFKAMRRCRTCGLPARTFALFLMVFIHARSDSAIRAKPKHRFETISIRVRQGAIALEKKVIRSISHIRFHLFVSGLIVFYDN